MKKYLRVASIDGVAFAPNSGSAFGGADHDVTVVRRELATTGVAGFFAGGELGPVGGRNHLHGFTAAVLAFPA